MAKLFFSYSHKDEDLRDRLEVALAMLKRQDVIETWHDRRITAGSELDGAISKELEAADIILLLISPDFLASNYCYDIEMARAMERHAAGNARVIPVILRVCDWHSAPFGKLMATPPDAKPITKHADLDEAFHAVAQAIRKAAAEIGPSPVEVMTPRITVVGHTRSHERPRSSNLRLIKSFTDADRDRFLEDSFSYLANFFENSLAELEARNPGISASFRVIDANQFTAVIYREGKQISRCSIRLGNDLGNGITYSSSDAGSGFNEQLSVASDDQSLFLKSLGMASMRGSRDEKLTQEGGAELYWSMLIGPLQQRTEWN